MVAASCYLWGAIVQKTIEIIKIKKDCQNFKDYVEKMSRLKTLVTDEECINSSLYDAIFTQAIKPQEHNQKEKIWKGLIENILKEWEAKLSKGLDYLGSIGTIAPFVGLFGTVWGIMNSFQAIANSNSTSISVVAPGISEALFATAFGLFVAIPATLGANILNSKIEEMLKESELFAFSLLQRLRKEL